MDNQELLSRCLEVYAAKEGPRVGDFVIYPDGHEERCSYDWSPEVDVMQTSYRGSFAMGIGYVSFSGALNPGVPKSELWPQRFEYRLGSCWIADRDYLTRGCAVDITIPWRVFRYMPARKYEEDTDR